MDRLLEVLASKHRSVEQNIAVGESVQPAQVNSLMEKLHSECLASLSTVDESVQRQAKGALLQAFASVGTWHIL